MGLVSNIVAGFSTLLSPVNMLLFLGALALGMFSGAIPGMSGLMAVVLLIPLTYVLDPSTAIMVLGVIYVASVYGGSLSAILFKVPGQSNSVMTTLDGYEMNQNGRLSEAISTAVFASAVGGIIGTVILILFSPTLAEWAVGMSDAEFFAVIFMGLALVSTIGADNITKSVMMMAIGLFIGTVGLDPTTSQTRFTFGLRSLFTGIGFVPIILGTFAVAEVFNQIRSGGQMVVSDSNDDTSDVSDVSWLPPFNYFKRFPKIIPVNSVLGTLIGVLPGAGATTGALFGYTFAQRIVPKNVREKFGTGIPEGVAAPEAANNSAAAGAFVPLLTLGIPGSGTTAVILAAFILHGLRPGPALIENQTNLVYTLFAGLLLANIGILLLNRLVVRSYLKVRLIPQSILLTLILMFTVIGAFAINNIMLDVWIMIVAGVIAYYLLDYSYPVTPLVIGLVLGPLAEPSLRRALVKSGGDMSVFFTRPISGVLMVAGILLFTVPLILDNRDGIRTIISTRVRSHE